MKGQISDGGGSVKAAQVATLYAKLAQANLLTSDRVGKTETK